MPCIITPDPRRGYLVTLSREDGVLARVVGLNWHHNALKIGAQDKLGRTDVKKSVLGAAGEIAFAAFRGVPYDAKTIEVFHTRPDVAGHEVRTRANARGSLVVRPRHNDSPWDVPYVLVVYEQGFTFRVVGWMKRAEIEQDCYWHPEYGKPEAWWVPQSALHPFPAPERSHGRQRDQEPSRASR